MALYFRLIGIHVRGQMQYRLSFLMDVLSTGVVNLVSFMTLAAVLSRFGAIGGWTLGEVAFLYGVVEVSFGLMDMIFTGFDPDVFSHFIRRGTFDQFLLRPLSLPLQVLTSEFALRRVGRILQGAAILGASLVLGSIDWTIAKALYLPLVIASTVAFFGGLFVIGSTITFWTVQSVEAINIFTYGGSEMMSYPMHIYGAGLRRFFTFIVPAALLTYYPALYFLDRPDPIGLPPFMSFLSPLAGTAVLAIAFLFWQLGVRHYTSTGT